MGVKYVCAPFCLVKRDRSDEELEHEFDLAVKRLKRLFWFTGYTIEDWWVRWASDWLKGNHRGAAAWIALVALDKHQPAIRWLSQVRKEINHLMYCTIATACFLYGQELTAAHGAEWYRIIWKKLKSTIYSDSHLDMLSAALWADSPELALAMLQSDIISIEKLLWEIREYTNEFEWSYSKWGRLRLFLKERVV